MPNLLATTWGRRVAFFLLYVTEGVPFGFTAVAVVTHMRERGVSPREIGVFVALLYLPWAWKWAAGPVVDLVASERLGRRRGWIVGCQLMMIATLLIAWPVDFTTRFQIFMNVIFVHNVFAAVQDVAIDALAVGTLPKEERGVVNGLMFAGSYSGQMLGGSGVLFLSAVMPFNATFPFVCGAILAVTIGISIWLREPRTALPVEAEIIQSGWLRRLAGELAAYTLTAIKALFGSGRAIAGLVFALLPAGAYALSLQLQSSLAVELGMKVDRIAWLTLFSSLLSAAGCVTGGWLSDKFGRRRMIALYIVLTAFPTLLMGWFMLRHGWIMPVDPTAEDRPVAAVSLVRAFWAMTLTYSFLFGLTYGARMALFMDLCDPAVAATQFTAYMAMMNLVISYTATWQGYLVEWVGYPKTLAIDASAGLLCLMLLPLMKPRPPEQADAVPVAFEVR